MSYPKILTHRLLVTAECLLLGTVLTNCSTTEGGPGQPAEVVHTTEVIALQKETLASTLQMPGELLSFQQVDLYAREQGFVKKLYADVGSDVTDGQLLLSLEAPELTSRLAAAESKWKSQQAIYTASKATYERLVETSKTPGTISPNDLDQAKARMESDHAQLEAAQAGYREVSNTRDYLAIRAPFSGIITARNVDPGAYVGPSGRGAEQPLFTLQEQKRLRLVVSVPEAHTSLLKKGDSVSFRVKALPNENFSARIVRKAGALDSRLRAERVEMDVLNNDKKLLPGMIADVTIPLLGDSTFVVPRSAVVNSSELVFVIKVAGDHAEWVEVQTGRSVNGQVEIYGNLAPGDRLVKSASEEIRKGSPMGPVKLADE